MNGIFADIESEIRLFAGDYVCYQEIKEKEDTVKLYKEVRISCFCLFTFADILVCPQLWGLSPVECKKRNMSRRNEKDELDTRK